MLDYVYLKMKTQESVDYSRIAKAISYIKQHFKEQPGLEEIAQHVQLSPSHFQRLFTQWAGTSPKKFVQYMSVNYAKSLLRQNQATLFDAAYETGLSGTGRLHDLFVHIEGMTPAEYKKGGENLSINYAFADSPFGPLLIASTEKGICHMAFFNEEAEAFSRLEKTFQKASFYKRTDPLQQSALAVFQGNGDPLAQVKLHLKGTAFQLKVWEALLKIPLGKLSTYGTIAHEIDRPGASRAVGTAIGQNPVAFIIPCHRVIQSSGALGGYMWGETRKTAIIGWEASRVHL